MRNHEELAAAAPFLYRESLAAGRVVLHVEQLRACLAAIESANCATPEALIDCDSYPIFEPRVAPGQVCAWGFDCIDGFCDRDFDAGAEFGKCVIGAPNGTPCISSQECSTSLCRFDPAGSRCDEPGADGEACTFHQDCASGICVCEVPEQRNCISATGACGPPPPENGCTLD